MFLRDILKTTLLLFVVLIIGGSAQAQTGSDPILKMDSQSEVELDMSVIIAEMKPLLLDILAMEGDENPEMAQFIMDLLGVEAMDRLSMESKQKKGRATSKMELTLDPDKDGGLLGKLMATKKGKCGFGKYLSKDQLAMFITYHNFQATLGVLLETLAEPEIASLTGDLPRDENGYLSFDGFTPRTDLLPLFSGELDIFLMDSADGYDLNSPERMPYFMVLGSTDGFALRDKIFEIAATFGGQEGDGLTQMIAEIPAEQVGEFELKETPFGGAFAVSQDYLVIGMTAEPLRELLVEKKGDLKVPDGHEYIYMNGTKYGEVMEGIMNMAAMGDPEDAQMNLLLGKIYSIMFQYIEDETVLVTLSPNRMVAEAEVNGNVATGMYQMVNALLVELPAIIEMEKLKDEHDEVLGALQEVVGIVDEAMTAYGIDNDGHFPAHPLELIDAGYLEDFPLDMEVPAGTYVEGAYTYHTLQDEDGQIIGYYFFVYGGGEYEGYDVYTPENLADLDNFVVDSDGYADGVGSFCYDGIAFEQMEAWRNK